MAHINDSEAAMAANNIQTAAAASAASSALNIRVVVRFRPLPSSLADDAADWASRFELDSVPSQQQQQQQQHPNVKASPSPRHSPQLIPASPHQRNASASFDKKPAWNSTAARPSDALPQTNRRMSRQSIGSKTEAAAASAFTSPKPVRSNSNASPPLKPVRSNSNGSPPPEPLDSPSLDSTAPSFHDSNGPGLSISTGSSAETSPLKFEADGRTVTVAGATPLAHSKKLSVSSLQAAAATPASRTYTFDRVFEPSSSQYELFESVGKGCVDDCLAGYNSTVLSYGQTGSGKTWSMFGGVHESESGLIPRAAAYLFSKLAFLINSKEVVEVNVNLLFMELYLEEIRDLLLAASNTLAPELKVRESAGSGEIFVQNLSSHPVSNADELLRLLAFGSRNRTISSTRLNTSSSRAHAVATILVSQRLADGSTRSSKLNLGDLAGSEKVKVSGAEGTQLRESKHINTSLAALSNVIVALTSPNRSHIPFRDSSLTFLLRDSLSGNTRTTMLFCASSSSDVSTVNETINTLEFARRTKKIKTNASVNRQRSVEELSKTVAILREQLQSLQGGKLERSTSASKANDKSQMLPVLTSDIAVQAPSDVEEADDAAAALLSRWDLLAQISELNSHSTNLSTENFLLTQQNNEYVAQVSNLESSLRSLQSILDSKASSRVSSTSASPTPSPNAKVLALQAELESAQASLATSEQTCQSLSLSSSKHISELQSMLATQTQSHKFQMEALEYTRSSLMQQLEDSKKDREREQSKHQSQVTSLDAELASLRRSHELALAAADPFKLATSINASGDSTYSNLLTELSNSHSIVSTLTGEKESLSASLQKKAEELALFSTQVELIQKKFEQIVVEKARSDDQVQRLIRNYEAQDAQCLEIKTELRAKTDKLHALERELDEAKRHAVEAQRDFQDQLADEKCTISKLQAELSRSQLTSSTSSTDSDLSTSEHAELLELRSHEAAHDMVLSKLAARDKEISDLMSNVTNLLHKYKAAQSSIVESQFELDNATKENAIHLITIQELQTQNESMSLSLANLTHTASSSAAKNDENSQAEAEAHEKLIAEYQTMLMKKDEKLAAEVAKLTAQAESSKSKLIQSYESIQAKLTEELQSAQAQLQSAQSQLSALEQSHKTELANLKSKPAQTPKDQLAALQKELTTTKDALAKLESSSKAQAKSHAAKLAEQHKLVSTKESALQSGYSQMVALQARVDAAEKSSKESLNQIASLRSELLAKDAESNDSMRQCMELQQKLIAGEQEKDVLHAKIRSQPPSPIKSPRSPDGQSSIGQLQTEVQSLTLNLASASAQNSMLRDSLQPLQDSLKEALYKEALAKTELATAQESFQLQLASMTRDVAAAVNETAFVKSCLSKVQAEFLTNKTELDASNNRIETAELQLLAVKKVGLETASQLKVLQAKYDEQTKELETKSRGVSAFTPTKPKSLPPAAAHVPSTPASLASTAADLAQVQKSLQQARVKLAEYVKLLQKKDVQITGLNQQVKELKQQIEKLKSSLATQPTSSNFDDAESSDAVHETIAHLSSQLAHVRSSQAAAEFALTRSPYGIQGQLWKTELWNDDGEAQDASAASALSSPHHNNHNAGPRIVKSVKILKRDGLFSPAKTSSADDDSDPTIPRFEPNDSGIAVQGYVDQKPSALGTLLELSTAWQRRYACLRDDSRLLFIYAIVDEVDQSLEERTHLAIDSSTKVSHLPQGDSDRPPFAFEVVSGKQTVQLACHNGAEATVWVDALLTIIARCNVELHLKSQNSTATPLRVSLNHVSGSPVHRLARTNSFASSSSIAAASPHMHTSGPSSRATNGSSFQTPTARERPSQSSAASTPAASAPSLNRPQSYSFLLH